MGDLCLVSSLVLLPVAKKYHRLGCFFEGFLFFFAKKKNPGSNQEVHPSPAYVGPLLLPPGTTGFLSQVLSKKRLKKQKWVKNLGFERCWWCLVVLLQGLTGNFWEIL